MSEKPSGEVAKVSDKPKETAKEPAKEPAPSKDPAPALVGPNGQRPIPIALLRFDGRMIDIPGKSGATSVTATTQANRHRHVISHLPWLRCFRIELIPSGQHKTTEHLHVPESWCTYELAEP